MVPWANHVWTEILAKLAEMYLVSFDKCPLETYKALAAQAAQYSLLDVEMRALIDTAYPLAWISSERCLEVLACASTQCHARRSAPTGTHARELPCPARVGRRVEFARCRRVLAG